MDSEGASVALVESEDVFVINGRTMDIKGCSPPLLVATSQLVGWLGERELAPLQHPV